MDIDQSFSMTIGGVGISGASTFSVVNPATEEEVAKAPACSSAQLDDAVAAAREAFPMWRATPVEKRREAILALAEAIAGKAFELKTLLTREQGKPFQAAEMELLGAAQWLQGAASLDIPLTVNEDSESRLSETRHVPIGVVGAISPWNFPVILSMFKLGPALLAGNTLVLKPSPQSPLTMLKIGELARTIFPPGVINVISGADELGPLMTSHPGIDKISFTGSTATGRKVMASASATLKRVTLELGGNDAAIVLPDVDVEKVAEKLFWAACNNSGQICVATKRIYVHRDVYDALKQALVAFTEGVKVGDGSKETTQLGPIQNKVQYDRLRDLIADSRANGHSFLSGGSEFSSPGYFLPVTILDNPPDQARIVREEQFGPIIPLMVFDNVEDAILRANDSEYGLAASVWSADLAKATEIGERLEVGTVWINETQYMTPLAAFGGHKQSGVGTENGVEGLLEYTLPKTIVVNKDPL